jgi:hypothetical protein
MATQKFCDNYNSTLSSAYTAGDGTLNVASAGTGGSELPTSGDFYVLVEAEGANTVEVFLCSGRTGTALNVAGAQAGTTASNHASGATIRGVILTAAAMRQSRAETVRYLTRAAQSALSGDERFGTVFLTDQPYGAIWTGTEWKYYLNADSGSGGLASPLDLSGFSWLNQGSATISSDGRTLQAPADASFSVHARIKAAPSTPYVLEAAFIPSQVPHNYATAGLLLYDSVSGKSLAFSVVRVASAAHLVVSKNSSVTVEDGAAYYDVDWSSALSLSPVYMRIADNGTDLTYSVSNDGNAWITVLTQGRTVYIAGGPTHTGFFVNPRHTSYPCGLTLTRWRES